ncbi:sensor histidine kinase [Pseudozobellia sp. WGM2]|uniref:sensor histidine kinase n=1 Tax=Pseudozobellia sp. WGM2 TaxID=2787625 RepID=UPI001AE054DD|nr:histidine kinase [Pseudozobellia sp. WGM2]
MNKDERRFNIFFWTAYFLYEWLGNASVGDEYYRYFTSALVIVPLTFFAAIFTVHYLLKRYYLRNQKKIFWFCLFVSIIAFSIARRTFNYFHTYPNYYPEGLIDMPYIYWPKILIEAVNTYLIVALYAMFYFVRELYRQQEISQELRQDKVETELKLLKSQVQPHFIFNTLNNIYSMAKIGHPDTADLIYRLSGFLSYNLYDSGKDLITVEQELDYVRHYVELEKIRHGKSLDIAINVFDKLSGYKVSPMVFLPFVENAFKHGLDDKEENSWIRIDLSIKHDWLIFKIENSLSENQTTDEIKRGGIGLENTRKRLEILYPGRHTLLCRKDEDSYLVTLKLKLNGNKVYHS